MLTRLKSVPRISVSLPGRYAIIAIGLTLLSLLASIGTARATAAQPLALTPRPATTPADAWQRWDEGLPSIATVLTVIADPVHPGVLYAGTHYPPGLWRSADSGETWMQEDFAEKSGHASHPVYTLLWDAGRHRLWAGTAAGLFYRDGDSPVWQLTAGPDGPIFDLAQDASGRIYTVQAETGLFRLDKSGDWAHLHATDRALAVDVSPSGQVIFLGAAGEGLWISRDGGEQWQQAPDFQEAFVTALLVSQEAGGPVFVSSSEGGFQSDDQGRSWKLIPALGKRVYTFHLASDGALYAGLKGRVARSDDGGQTWSMSVAGQSPNGTVLGLDTVVTVHPPPTSPRNHPPPTSPRNQGEAFKLPPADGGIEGGRSERLHTVDQAEGGYVLVAATRDGIYRSADRGDNWQRHRTGLGDNHRVEALIMDAEGGIIAATPHGLYRRPPDATMWQSIAPTFKHTHIYDLSSDASRRTIYAGTERGLLRSTDSGQTWREVISELPPRGMPGVLADPANPDHLFVRLAFERIYESNDGGLTWQARWEGMETHHVVLSMARSPAGDFLAGSHKGLFRWSKQDRQWRNEALTPPDQAVYAVAFDPSENRQYAGSTAGLWRRSGEEGWQRCGAGMIQNSVSALAALPAGHIYAGTWYAGLYRSCDGGENWRRVSAVPVNATVTDLLVDSEASMVYAATDRGLFRGPDSACPAETASPIEKRGFWDNLMVLEQRLADARDLSTASPLPAVHTLRPDDSLLQQAKEIGFQAIVQVFSWAEIEPAPGVWHWEYPDFLVRATAYYDLDLIVRLDHPPDWALAPPADDGSFPFDVDAYLRFVDAVARRYQGCIRGYIVWNEPNLAAEWGAPPDPTAYTRLLQRTYVVIKRADPSATVASAGLASTNERSELGLDDRLFLEGMYDAGARPFFDALGAHPYGFAYPPDDPHGQHDELNVNRILDLRDVMEANEDADKPVWATEFGWTTAGLGAHGWLTVTPQQQADYLADAWRMVREEWDWLDMFTVWNLAAVSRSVGDEPDEMAGYSLLDENGRPKLAWHAVQSTITATQPRRSADALWERLAARFSDQPSSVVILAQDQIIHLGDNE